LLTGTEKYQRHATTILRLLADQIRRYPSAFSWALCGLDFYLATPKEIAIVSRGASAPHDAMVREVWGRYFPNRIIACTTENYDRAAKIVPLLAGRAPADDQPTAFVCEAYTCQTPAKSVAELRRQLASRPV
jgi:hypothetical protein